MRFGWILLAGMLAACSHTRTYAPVAQDMRVYGHELARAQQEQLLLNIVRLRYNDPVSFLSAETISTEDSATLSGGLASALGLDDGPFSEVLGGEAGYERTYAPTVVYSPLQGGAYAQQLLKPVAPESIFLLSQSGWSVERLLLCCVARIGALDNARSAAGPTPDRLPDNLAFRELALDLRRMQVAGDLLVQVIEDGEEEGEYRVMVTWRATTPEGKALASRVGAKLSADAGMYEISIGARSGRSDVVVRGRSILGMLSALSQTVNVPPEHASLVGQVSGGTPQRQITSCSPAAPWGEVLGDFFAVRWSYERPEGAAVAVPYRGVWFHVDDTCRSAKSTLDLIGHLYALQAGLTEGGGRDTLLLLGG